MITREEYLKALDLVEKYNKQLRSSFDLPNGHKFRSRRKMLGMTMEDVSKSTGTSQATICRLENDKDVHYKTVRILNEFYLKNEIQYK